MVMGLGFKDLTKYHSYAAKAKPVLKKLKLKSHIMPLESLKAFIRKIAGLFHRQVVGSPLFKIMFNILKSLA